MGNGQRKISTNEISIKNLIDAINNSDDAYIEMYFERDMEINYKELFCGFVSGRYGCCHENVQECLKDDIMGIKLYNTCSRNKRADVLYRIFYKVVDGRIADSEYSRRLMIEHLSKYEGYEKSIKWLKDNEYVEYSYEETT